MSKQWNYSCAPASQHGTMVCTACRKKITEGQYRVRETPEAYLSQHRKCSETDPNWGELNAQAEKKKQHFANYLAACIEFKNEWGCDELDELIHELQAAHGIKGDA